MAIFVLIGAGATEEKFFFEKKSPQPSRIQRLNSIPCQCDKTPEMTNIDEDENFKDAGEEIVKEILKDVIEKVIKSSTNSSSSIHEQVSNESSNTTAAVEIDCTEPEIKVSPRRTVEIDISDAQPNSGTVGDSSCSRQRRKKSSKTKSVEEENSASTSNPSRGKKN